MDESLEPKVGSCGIPVFENDTAKFYSDPINWAYLLAIYFVVSYLRCPFNQIKNGIDNRIDNPFRRVVASLDRRY